MARNTSPTRVTMNALKAAQPLAERLPAVAAGQLGDWPAGWIRSYRVYAEQLDELTLYNDYFQKGEYNMLAQYHTTDIVDPDSIVNYAMNFDGGTGAIWTGYQNPQIAELTLAAQEETDPAKREEMYHQIQQMSLDDAQVLFLYFPPSRTALHDWVHDFKVQPTGNYRMWEVWTTRE